MRRTIGLILAGTAALALLGCEGQAADDRGEPEVASIPTIRDASELVLPFDPYLVFVTSWQVPDRAINMLGRQCMQRFGLDWPVIEGVPPNETVIHARRYGLFDPVHATAYGYHPAPKPDGEWQARQERDPTPEEAALWAGEGESQLAGQAVPPGGCAGEAMRTLSAGGPEAPMINPEQLANADHKRAEQDSRVQAVFGRWSTCMRDRGFHYTTPMDALNDPRWHDEAVRTAELETAKADVACKQETNVVGTFFAVESAYQRRTIEDNAQQLNELQKHYDALLRNAAKVVSGQ
ncbi:hypothetical protein J2S43_003649 [Catenuloplanes nepalensis]|uniref:Secreted protein n=1 Tax=Catenuloplanes nepalensis TaxID=587533 RepID=A0ABT9MUL7_9ACTN|nr:hypothetical protein [Catenuloplanes nepalensis]MDP9795137.1 hypothetical protein [Catenuloplanes nepalensis]